ncbi:DUF2383 domain-containing protein [Seonamhaeicola sp. ML3]|uniref:DUF2383 domain-containing protein n=1 Tax=Seonamhaeicola sp. ML3 TaxID=2937786 RepID=UPI00200CE362|nr:DUF2383 domain-containing protein [Seonamhaeicola sp. ML3]
MKQIEPIIEKLNDLLVLNEEVESTYKKASEKLKFADNIAYSKQRSLERAQFVKSLKIELAKLEDKVENAIVFKRRLQLVRSNLKTQLKIGDDLEFVSKVYEIEVLSSNKYDELLSQINLPLSLCRMLLKQRDSIEARLRILDRGEGVIV